VTRLAVIALLAGCGDNLAAIDARAIEAPGTPDLALVPSMMDGTLVLTDDTFTASACELVEGCIGDAGTRRLLRFNTVTANLGTADLALGPVPPAGVSSGIYVWSPCHMHHHVAGYADFSLWAGTDMVIAGHKQAFCLEDDTQIVPGGPSHGFRCNLQGITVGWADVYSRTQPCQWIDVTDVPPGTYTLKVEIDVSKQFPDEDRSNNMWMTNVVL
jgi:hypothetical protein